MPDSEQEIGPKLVWTFPLVTRFQSGEGILGSGSVVGTMMKNNRVGDRLKAINEQREQSEDTEETEDEFGQEEIESIEDDITDVSESGESIFSTSSEDESEDVEFEQAEVDGEATVDIEDDVFVPQRTKVDVGTTVVWQNNDDEVHRVVSVEGEEFDSGQLEPGESFSHTFDTEGTTVYIGSIKGGDEMSGAIIVGDAQLSRELPSEKQQPKRVPFEEKESQSTRTMSEAADDKEQMLDGVMS